MALRFTKSRKQHMKQYTDIPPELMGKSDPDDLWIKAQLIRIDPSIEHYDTEHSVARATRLLVLELRDKLATPQAETGGPAFPAFEVRTHDTGDLVANASQGITVRDYFAAKAMQAVIARGDDTNRPGMAEWSYAMADAMLKARAA